MPDVKDMWELLWDIHEKSKGTTWETAIPAIVIAAVIFLVVKFIFIPVGKYAVRLYKYILTNWFIKKKVYEGLSFMDSKDVYYAINNFVPTRFSTIDPSNNDEPAPEYTVYEDEKRGREKEPLLIDRFIKYEYSIKEGKKYYLCLGDCGMGKTTFLINLYYQTLKMHKYKCVFISLQDENCINRIEKIEDQANTVLLLDALDENDSAVANYSEFANRLERATRNFYRVIITARTNFFASEINEKLTNNKNSVSVSSKLSSSNKFYITPFTDEDIKKYLRIKYHFNNRKMKLAWEVIEQNKNLSVRPLLLKFMDEIIVENRRFTYDFELYEFLFSKWIERERRSIDEELGKDLYEECLNLAKQIYYNWMKNGSVGIYPEDKEKGMSGIKAIKLKGHAMLNRTSDGMYKFSHKSYWEFLIAKLALYDIEFADSLCIKNFDRANEFLCEMISYNNLHEEQVDDKNRLCEAIYLLKYESVSGAETKFRTVAQNSEYGSWMHITALVKLAESLLRQLKEASAKKVIYEAYEIINYIEFDMEHLHEFAEFACVFGRVSREYRIIDGQRYLERLIAYFRQYKVANYDLLRCYNVYSRCCMNYKNKQEAIREFEELTSLYFENDQYAAFNLLEAKSWKMSYNTVELRDMMGELLWQYSRFLDVYQSIVNNCDMGIAILAYQGDYSSVNIEENAAYTYFEEAYSLGSEIYEYDNVKPLKPGNIIYEESAAPGHNNIYMVIIQKMIFRAFSFTDRVELSEAAQPVFEYIDSNNLQNEMVITRIMLYTKIGKNCDEFEEAKEYLLKALDLANEIENTYFIADIYKWLFELCLEEGEKSTAIEYLNAAYNRFLADESMHETPEYCTIMKLLLENTDDNNEALARKLFETARNVYGTDKRKWHIYNLLCSYYENDKRIIEIETELLKCEFSRGNLEHLFDSCVEYGEKDSFGVIVNSIIIEGDGITEEAYIALESFIKEKGNELDRDVVKFLNATISKMTRGSRRRPENDSYFTSKGSAGIGKTNLLRMRYDHSLGVSRLAPYINSAVDNEIIEEQKRREELLEIQRELEKKFDELFGTQND